jgi:hypothetical protein
MTCHTGCACGCSCAKALAGSSEVGIPADHLNAGADGGAPHLFKAFRILAHAALREPLPEVTADPLMRVRGEGMCRSGAGAALNGFARMRFSGAVRRCLASGCLHCRSETRDLTDPRAIRRALGAGRCARSGTA